jgi:hypothetical protein
MSEDVFRWVIAVGVLLACVASIWQAVILSALFKAGKEAGRAAGEAQGKLGPLVDRFDAMITVSGKILEDNRAHIAEIASETLAVARTVRQQADRIAVLVDDANSRAKARIAQIDQTVDQTVAHVEQARDAVKGAVMTPVREVGGFVAGVKAAVSTYAQGGNRHSPERATQDEEMFI